MIDNNRLTTKAAIQKVFRKIPPLSSDVDALRRTGLMLPFDLMNIHERMPRARSTEINLFLSNTGP
jgi:hypothetical protein